MPQSVLSLKSIITAIEHRPQPADRDALRLFNGFYEGLPGLVVDRYGPALVVFHYGPPGEHQDLILDVSRWALHNLAGLSTVLLKQRQHPDETVKNGTLILGSSLPGSIREFGVKYALDLRMNQDAGFYLDTRDLRRWLIKNMSAQRILNTFAYTGSLGVAAGVGGANAVIQTDISSSFLRMAQDSWQLNQLPANRCQLLVGDFFRIVGRLRQQEQLFDCVILDPPFFSDTAAGRVDLQQNTVRLINKVRPLVGHEGYLVAINNALFHSGQDFMAEIDALCQSPYLQFESIIKVPPDITGFPETIVDAPPVDPSPFNHPTKIVILKVFRKDQKRSGG